MSPLRGPIVIDTSVAAKWFLSTELYAEQARSLRALHLSEQVTLCAPSLLLWELGSVLRHKPGVNPSDALNALQSVLDLEVQFFEPSPGLLQGALARAYGDGVTVYDAAFVALADQLGCIVITADERLAQKMGLPSVQLLSKL